MEDTDRYFRTTQVINFDIIRNQKTITKNKFEQYQTVRYDAIRKYPSVEQARITSSIFRNIDRSDLHVTPAFVKSHFNKNFSSPKTSVGRGRFLKICRDTMYAKYW